MAIDPSGHAADWLVPRAPGPVRAEVRLPGSKSMTNRALVLAALADGPTRINGALIARDTSLMADALRALGCRLEDSPAGWQVLPMQLGATEAARPAIGVDVGNAGTVLRFVPPVATLTGADVTFRGDERMSQRPVAPLLTALRALGAQITDGGTGAVPFTVHGRGTLAGGSVALDASSSSQLISALLLTAARFGVGAEITHVGPPVPSEPHIEMTLRMLRSRGVGVEAGDGTSRDGIVTRNWRVSPGPIAAGQIDIEPDLSNALPFLAAALVTGGEVTVAGWPADSLQPTARIVELLTEMGADVHEVPEGLRVRGSGEVQGLRADLSEVGELTPVLAALASLASTPSELTGIGHVRKHETDRLAALTSEIGKMGGDVTELADGLRIRPSRLTGKGVVFDSHDDHRMVMAAAVLGLVTDGMAVRNAATVRKTFPEFSQFWTGILSPAR